MHTERIDPERLRKLRISGSDMTSNAFAEAEVGENPERACQAFLAVPALILKRGEDRHAEPPEGRLVSVLLGALECGSICSGFGCHRILLGMTGTGQRQQT
jgi:hypothetical protein